MKIDKETLDKVHKIFLLANPKLKKDEYCNLVFETLVKRVSFRNYRDRKVQIVFKNNRVFYVWFDKDTNNHYFQNNTEYCQGTLDRSDSFDTYAHKNERYLSNLISRARQFVTYGPEL
jgi:hypothetical protein